MSHKTRPSSSLPTALPASLPIALQQYCTSISSSTISPSTQQNGALRTLHNTLRMGSSNLDWEESDLSSQSGVESPDLVASTSAISHHIDKISLFFPPSMRGQFPVKLYTMLEYADEMGLRCCTWLPHGRAFMILDEAGLMKIVPTFFNQTKIRSFQRQLYLWDYFR